MREFEVNCITLKVPHGSHQDITHIGNTQGRWRRHRDLVIRMLEAKQEAYYTVDPETGKRSYVGVVRTKGKVPYLRAYANGWWNDSLLSLPACEKQCRVA